MQYHRGIIFFVYLRQLTLLSATAEGDITCVGASCTAGGALLQSKHGVSQVDTQDEFEFEAFMADNNSDKRDALVKYGNDLYECLKQVNETSNTKMKDRVAKLVAFELNKKAADLGLIVPGDEAMGALTESATAAAADIVHDQIVDTMNQTLGHGSFTDETVDSFITTLENAATACGDGEEAEVLGHTERAILNASGHGAGEIGRRVASEIPNDINEKCKQEVMDVDFLVGRGVLLTHATQCLPPVAAALEQQSHVVRRHLNYHMKQVLVLHNATNGLGHAMAKYWKRHGLAAHRMAPRSAAQRMHDQIVGAAASQLSKTQLMQLQYLEDRHLSSVMDFSVKEFCEQKPNEKYRMEGYRNCICSEGQLEFVCRAKHEAELNTAYKQMSQNLKAAKLRFQQANMSRSSGGGTVGPCAPPIECELCAGTLCISTSIPGRGGTRRRQKGKKVDNIFKGMETELLLQPSSSCMSGGCGYSWGAPAGVCSVKFQVRLGAEVGSCDNPRQVFSTFKVSITTELCLDALADIADALGWTACVSVSDLSYYPFIGKVYAAMSLPAKLPGIKAELRVTAPVHDLTAPVKSWIDGTPYNSEQKKVPILWCETICAVSPPMCDWLKSSLCMIYDESKRKLGKTAAVREYYNALMMMERSSLDIDITVQAWTFTWVDLHTFHVD